VHLACAGALSAAALFAAGCGAAGTASTESSATLAAANAEVASTTTAKHNHAPAHGNRPATRAHHAPAHAPAHNTATTATQAHKAQPTAAPTGGTPAPVTTHQSYAPPRITRGKVVQKPAEGTGGNTPNDDNPARKASNADSGGRPTIAGQPNPCALVSAAQMQSITGRSVNVAEAPLGPTCIYELSGVKAPVTVTVERLNLPGLKPHISNLSQFKISGHDAYCGRYGSPVTYVPLSGGLVLNVTAPCSVGSKFAAVALTKLGA
jgi:hypothetical protein